jgi:hypothetical protein
MNAERRIPLTVYSRSRAKARLALSMVFVAATFVLGAGSVMGAVSQTNLTGESDLPELVDPVDLVSLRSADRTDVISEIRSVAAPVHFDQYSIRDVELNENPPMYRSAGAEENGTEWFDLMERAPGLYSEEKAERTGGAALINRLGEGVNNYQFIEENTVLPGLANSADWKGTMFEHQFIEGNTMLPGLADSSDWKGTMFEYQFIEENTVLPGLADSEDWKGTMYEYQFIEGNTVLPDASASTGSNGTQFEHRYIEENRARSKLGPSNPARISDLPGPIEHDY